MNPGTTPATTSATTWGQRNWVELLRYIEQKSVIPILGPDLVLVERDGRELALVERIVAPYLDKCRSPSPTP